MFLRDENYEVKFMKRGTIKKMSDGGGGDAHRKSPQKNEKLNQFSFFCGLFV